MGGSFGVSEVWRGVLGGGAERSEKCVLCSRYCVWGIEIRKLLRFLFCSLKLMTLTELSRMYG